MKLKLLTLVLIINITLVFSQGENINESSSKKIKIENPTEAVLLKVQEAGIDLSCGAVFKDNSLFVELNSTELENLKKERIPYTIEIEDLTKFYSERAVMNLPTAKAELKAAQAYHKLKKKQQVSLKSTSSISSVVLDNPLQYTGVNEVDWVISSSNFNLGSMGGCLTLSEMKTELDDMRTYSENNGLNIVSVKQDASSTGQKTWGNPELSTLNPLYNSSDSPTNGPQYYTGQGTSYWNPDTIYYVRITGNESGSPENTKPQMLFTSMIHSREVSALMNNIYFMWYLIENYDTDAAVKELVDNNELYFVPVVNPDGLRWNEHLSSTGGGMQRKNLRPNTGGTGSTSVDRGVDLNRNFDYFWGYNNTGSSSLGTNNGANSDYRGPSRASEPETQIMVDFILNRNFKTSVWNHSYANSVPHPYGGIPSESSGREDEFYRWHEEMTRYNRYLYGATIFYESNGLPDDWMAGSYDDGVNPPVPDLNGSIGSGQGILGTTPEHGSSGFWPTPALIVPIAKQSMRISFGTAYYGGKYAKLHDLTQSNIASTTANLDFGIERVGQTGSNFTVTVTPISSNISNITSPATEIGMPVLSQRIITATLELNSGITANEKIEYNVKLSNDNGVIYEANFEKYYLPTLLFNHIPDTNGLTGWTESGGWINTTSDAYSNTNSLSTGTYSNSITKTLTTTSSYDFSNATKVLIQFYSKWDIERNYDFVEVLGSPDGGSNWIALSGKYTKPNATSATTSHDNKSNTYANFQANSSGQIYDGDRMDNWVMEEIAIDDTYLSLLNSSTVKIRFNFRTDGLNVSENYSTTSDGFFIDDFKIISVQEPCVITTPIGLVSSSITNVGATINWVNIPSATYDLRYKETSSPLWIDVSGLSSNTYNLTGLSALTEYEVQVRSKCDASNSAYTTISEKFTTLAPSYCSSTGDTTARGITNVTFVGETTIDNSDTNNTNTGYEDFSDSLSADVYLGNSYNLSAIVDRGTGNIDLYTRVFIDFNRNGDFDVGEGFDFGIFNRDSGPMPAITIPVPTALAGAKTGAARMRISAKASSTPLSCETGFSGEVEDYTVNIIDSTLSIEDDLLSDFSLYPNPVTNGEISLRMPNEITDFKVTISNVMGQQLFTENVDSISRNNHIVRTSGLKTGIYFVTVSTNLGKATKKMIIQ